MNLISRFRLQTSKNSFHLLTAFIVAVAAIMRLTNLGFSFSNDELSALMRCQYDSFGQLVDKGFYVDGHPGGIQVLLYYWTMIVGLNELAIRLPFALMGAAAVYFAIRLFTYWFGEIAGLMTGAALAFLEFPLLYSQIARPYGSGLFFSILMIYAWTLLLFDDKPGIRKALFFGLSAAACMYNHYFSFFLALTAGLTGLFFVKRENSKLYLFSGILAALLFSPHIYITLNHLSIGGVGLWLAKPGPGWVVQHIYYIFNNSMLMLVLFATSAAALTLMSFNHFRFTKFHFFALLLFLFPLITGYIYSNLVNPVLQDSVLIFSFPFLIALFFSFTGKKIQNQSISLLIALFLTGGVFETTAVNQYYKKQHFGEFRGIANAIAAWNQEYSADSITRVISINNLWYLNVYLDKINAPHCSFAQTDNRGGPYLDTLARILSENTRPYFMYAYTKPVPAETEDLVRARFPFIVDEVDFDGLAKATLFSRQSISPLRVKPRIIFRQEETDSVTRGLQPLKSEFSAGYDGTLQALNAENEQLLVASAEIMTNGPSGGVLVVSFHNSDGETIFYYGAKADLFTVSGKWSQIRLSIPVSGINKSLRMKMYLWNPQHSTLFMRNLVLYSEMPFQQSNQN